ncbi:MAG: hypothetical protein EB060_01270 [Proteobacteria bacterium]|nr:hypothetical protein [Pseudomonadota bacterium]
MFSPALILLFGGIAMLMLRGLLFHILVVALPLITLSALILFSPTVLHLHMMGVDAYDVMVRPYSTLFACGFTLVAWMAGLMGMRTNKPRELALGYMYAGAAVMVVYASDYFFLLIAWELMALFATLLIWNGGMKDSGGAGMRYAVMHVLGGVLLLFGVTAKLALGSGGAFTPIEVDIQNFADSHMLPDILITLAVLINVAAPPFSAWVADSYAEASPSGAVLLSACTTKASIFVLLTLFTGNHFLLYVGVFMTLYGFLYAAFAQDVRKLLSYLLVSGLGVMVIGVSIGTPLAQASVVMQALSHMLYGAIFFVAAGIAIQSTGTRDIHAMRGFFKQSPLIGVAIVIAVMCAVAFPLSFSFLTKTLLIKAAISEGLHAVTLFISSCVVLGVAHFLFPWSLCFGSTDKRNAKAILPEQVAACVLGALMLMVLGLYPTLLLPLLPAKLSFNVYDVHGVFKQLILVAVSMVIFYRMLPWFSKVQKPLPDMDIIYRKTLVQLLMKVESVWNMLVEMVQIVGKGFMLRITAHARVYGSENGLLARTRTISSVVLMMVLMLLIVIGVYLFR